MPHFTLQITVQGPMLNASAVVSAGRRAALETAQLPIPSVVQIRALVDTGASGTCVDPVVLRALNLTPTGSVNVLTPSTGTIPHSADQYDIGLIVPGASREHPPLYLPTVAVLACDLLAAQGFHALIGRDILAECFLTYNGTMGLFTLAY